MNTPETWKIVRSESYGTLFNCEKGHPIFLMMGELTPAACAYCALAAAPTPEVRPQWWTLVLEYDQHDVFACKVCKQQFRVDVQGVSLPEECPNCNDRPGVARPTPEAERETQHLIRCAIALVAREDLSEVAGESRAVIAHKLQVMLAAPFPSEVEPVTVIGGFLQQDPSTIPTTDEHNALLVEQIEELREALNAHRDNAQKLVELNHKIITENTALKAALDKVKS